MSISGAAMTNVIKRVWQNHRWVRLTATAISITLAIALAAVGGIFTWLEWEWLRASEDGKASNGDTLRNVGFIVAGVAALIFAIWRGVVAQRQANAAQEQTTTAQQSLLNERYQRGAEMLGSPVLSVRLGGIFALQRLAEEHPEQYHVQVMRLFCAFVRNPPRMVGEPTVRGQLRADVQVAITAIGESSYDCQLLEEKAEYRLDLRNAHLENADMRWLNFAGVDLQNAYLTESDLTKTELSGANLMGADLSSAHLFSTDLSDADLLNTNLSDARLFDADLSNACVIGADLSNAYLDGANLSHSLISETNLSGAKLRNTNLSGAELEESNFSGANLAQADFSGTRTEMSDFSGVNMEGTIMSGAILGTGLIRTVSGEVMFPGIYVYIPQKQFDQAVTDPNNPPKIRIGAIDPETDEPLVWRGGSANPQS